MKPIDVEAGKAFEGLLRDNMTIAAGVDDFGRGLLLQARQVRKMIVETVMLKNAPVRRLFEPSEIGELVPYLCSNSAACFTGSCLAMDYSWTAS